MRQISVEIIQKCPNKCLHCSSFADSRCTWKLDSNIVKKVIDGAERLRTDILSISGGEPFLHEGLTEIVSYAKEKKLKVYIYTSGIIMNVAGEAACIEEETFELLKEKAVDKIIFDIPAIREEVYDKFMGTRGYQKFALESMKNAKRTGIFTEIHFVPTKLNLGEIDNVLNYAENIGIDKVSFLALVPHGRASLHRDELVLDTKEKKWLKEKLSHLAGDKIRIGIPLQLETEEGCCYAGVNKLCVRYDGKVFGCEAFKYVQLLDEHHNVVVPDSIYEDSLQNIFEHSRYLKYERRFISEQMKIRGCGEKCPVQRKMMNQI